MENVYDYMMRELAQYPDMTEETRRTLAQMALETVQSAKEQNLTKAEFHALIKAKKAEYFHPYNEALRVQQKRASFSVVD
ncbi:MAG: hypothetical protein AAF526_00220 [Pseudomonadota bacterium]